MSSVELVIFSLDKEEYGIDISYSQEIIRIPKHITKVPDMPSYVEGMFNLRGKVIPVIDLKKRFGFECMERGVDSRLLILNLGDALLGMVVDDVSEVLKVEEKEIEGLCSAVSGISGSSIKGICKVDERLILILNAVMVKNEIFKK